MARHVPALPEETIDLQGAIAATEQEILTDAFGNDPLDNDGDRSLEEMDEHPDGEDTEEGDAEELEAQGEEGEEHGEQDEPEDQEGTEAQGDELQQARDDQRQGRVPPHRMREATERAQAAEQERDQLRRVVEARTAEIASVHERLDNLMAQLASRGGASPSQVGAQQGVQQPQAELDPAPDMFADPQGYQRWIDRRIEAKAREIASASVNQGFEQHQAARVDVALDAAARGPRAYEFQPAYQALTSLNPRDPVNQRLVRGIFNAPDPAAAFWDWWDANGGEDYRAQVFEQLQQQFSPQQPQQRPRGGRMSHTDNPSTNGNRPRTEFRGPVERRTGPPSLNGAAGGNPQRGFDPRGMDPSDRSAFRYAFDDQQ